MIGDEERVERAFRDWLASEGWAVGDPPPELKFLDVLAERDGQKIYAEVKGRTAAIGTDVDTAYGQLLRRMPEFENETVRYALVVPDRAEAAALRCNLGFAMHCASTSTSSKRTAASDPRTSDGLQGWTSRHHAVDNARGGAHVPPAAVGLRGQESGRAQGLHSAA